MQPHSLLWHYLWLAPHVFQIAIFAVMIRRRLYRDYPVFFSYLLYEAILGFSLFALDHNPNVSPAQYWQFDWFGSVGSIALRFGLIWEIFSHVFDPYPALCAFGKMVFRWSALVLVVVAIAVALYSPAPDVPRILSGVYVVDRTISIIQCGLLLFLFLFSSYFGLSWRSYVLGIAIGLGFYSVVHLATSSIWMRAGPFNGSYIIDFVTMATFHCCVLIWFFYLVSQEPVRRSVGEIPHNELEVWDRELGRLLHG